MINTVFECYSRPIGSAYISFIKDYFPQCGQGSRVLVDYYEKYALLDSVFPRPILTFLGVNAFCDELQDITSFKDINLLLIPQLIRDFLAIHDDVIDEDIVKFCSDTIPYSFSKVIGTGNALLNKWGKDAAILFGDMQISAPLSIISSLNVDDKTKMRILSLVADVLRTTNSGQLEELLFDRVPLADISLDDISSMYKKKAADYCYAFPLELGLIYSGADSSIIEKMKGIMLEIGMYSQIINDLEGVFHEFYGNERDTLSDFIYNRKSYLLVKYFHETSNQRHINLMCQPQLSVEEAQELKEGILYSGVLRRIQTEVESGCETIVGRIKTLKVGEILQRYLLDLISSRIIDNIRKV